MQGYFDRDAKKYTIKDIYAMIDYSKSSLKERKKIVNDICNLGFFQEYFSDYYNPIKGQNSPLSDQDNICKLLEYLGTYLLNAKDVDSHDCTDQRYLIRKINKDNSLESIIDNTYTSDLALHNIISDDIGKIAKNKGVFYNSQDPYSIIEGLEIDQETLSLIDTYINYYQRLDKSRFSKQQVDRIKGGVAKDIETLVEGCYKDIIHDNLELSSSQQFYQSDEPIQRHDLSGASAHMGNTVAKDVGLLFMTREQGLDINDYMSVLLHDLDNIIAQSGLTEREYQVLELLQHGYLMKDIAVILNRHVNTITADRRSIVDKVLTKLQEFQNIEEV